MSRRSRWIGWGWLCGASSLLACNVLLGNDSGKLWTDGASPGAEAGVMDASVEDAPAPGEDGMTGADASEDGAATCGASPTNSCFREGGCTLQFLSVELSDSPETVKVKMHPHDLTVADGFLYFSAQEQNIQGQNGHGLGRLVQVRTDLKDMRVVSPEEHRSPAAPAVYGSLLFWRTLDSGGRRLSSLHSLNLAAWGGAPCTELECGYEPMVSGLPGWIDTIWPVSPTELYARADKKLLWIRKEADQWLSVPVPAPVSQTIGRLLPGFWLGWPELQSYDRKARLYSLAATPPSLLLEWSLSPMLNALDAESSLLATSCGNGFLYQHWLNPPLRRVDLDAGPEAANDQIFTPITCPDCPSTDVYAHVADSRFSYLGVPGVGLSVVDPSDGRAQQIVAGDVWDVAIDDAAVYATDVSGYKILRVETH